MVPPQVLPVWPVGCPSPDVLRPPHGFAVVSLKNGSATPPAVFQTNERWVSFAFTFFNDLHGWSWLFEVRISCTV